DEPEGSQRQAVEQELAQGRRDALAATGAFGKQPSQLEGDAGAGQAAKGICRARQARVHESVRARQRIPELMMVGDDQFQAQAPGRSSGGCRPRMGATRNRRAESSLVMPRFRRSWATTGDTRSTLARCSMASRSCGRRCQTLATASTIPFRQAPGWLCPKKGV